MDPVPIFPSSVGWKRGTPDSVGLNPKKLDQAKKYSLRFDGRSAGCVVRHGVLAYSWGPFSTPFNVQSAAKSFGSAVLGLAVDDGLVDIEAPAQRYLPTIGAIPKSNVAKGWLDNIRVEHLATHTAGFPKDRRPQPLAAKPGTRSIYSDGGVNWMAALLTKVYGRDLRNVAQERLFGPIGVPAKAAKWAAMDREFKSSPTCRFNGALMVTVDAMARFGQLYLHGGNWEGRRVLSEDYVKLSTSPCYDRIRVGALRKYGLLWWLDSVGGVPHYKSVGLYSNHTFVFPSLDMVVVRVGTDGWMEHGGSTRTFVTPIVAAVSGG